jgi:lycopene cyclase domain-containing protein
VPEYSVAAAVSVVVVVIIELAWLRTGLFRRGTYWAAMAIVFGFQVLVDGWLTKLSAPIVLYAEEQTIKVRAPWDIPVEDFAYGFTLVTLVLLLWVRRSDADGDESASRAQSSPSRTQGPGPGG